MLKRLKRKKERSFREELILKASKMSNKELRKEFLKIRKKTDQINIESVEEIDEEVEKLLMTEGIFSDELKKRELLEWALRSS